MSKKLGSVLFAASLMMGSLQAHAACSDVSYATLKGAVDAVLGAHNTVGFGLNMWATVVDETGKVCQVVTTGPSGALASRSEWLGSRVISAQKANTANAFSLNGVSISSGALYAAVQPGGSLFGLSDSNPVDPAAAYAGDPATYGTATDALVGKRVGGVNTFGGGIALYNAAHEKVGALGVSGDSSCTDHAFAWRVREYLGLGAANSPGGFERLTIASTYANLGDHPTCANVSFLTANKPIFGFQ
jgi:uncharacterized protein GlcG (DUF336 family)